MKKILIVLFISLFSFPIAFAFPPVQCGIEDCSNQLSYCMKNDGWCCGNYFYYGTDCFGTKIIFDVPNEEFCIYKNYIALKGNSTFLEVIMNCKYDGVDYDSVNLNCSLNEYYCQSSGNPGILKCYIPISFINFLDKNTMTCEGSHPTLIYIKNSSFIEFSPLNFSVNLENDKIKSGASLLTFYLISSNLIPTDFSLVLSSERRDVKIYEDVKKTSPLGCKDSEKVSFLVESNMPGLAQFYLLVRPNFQRINCKEDKDCSILENGKCINKECWSSYKFIIEIESKIKEFDFTYIFASFLSILALIFVILLIEAIVRR